MDSTIFQFLNQLSKHNQREWFQENKPQYEKAHAEAKVIFEAIYNQLAIIDQLEPLKTYRIYRDVRFSLDKTPYKNHFSGFTARQKPFHRGGFYVHLQPNNSFIGGGFWGPDKDDLLKIRKEIAVDTTLNKILADQPLVDAYGQLEGEELKTAPRGFDKNDPQVNLLRKKQFLLVHHFTDAEVLAADFPQKVKEYYQILMPFYTYMTDILTTNENGELVV